MLDSRVRRLQKDAADWYTKKPIVTPLVLDSFSRYRSTFAAASQALAAHISPAEAGTACSRCTTSSWPRDCGGEKCWG